ncbi:hypothetical protein ACFX15_039816 [Malus domestica]
MLLGTRSFKSFFGTQDLIAIDYLTLEWKAPSRLVNGESMIKLKGEWTQGEIASAMANRKAKNAIVSTMSSNQFAHVTYCTAAKQAWDKLRILHEGDK